jgi:BolA protein
MSRYERIKQALTAAFAPAALEITDESAKHAGHAAQKGVTGGETHYHITMVAAALTGQSRLARQRAVNAALAAEFSSGLHALSMTLRSPAEM